MQGPGVWVLTERGSTESPIGMDLKKKKKGFGRIASLNALNVA